MRARRGGAALLGVLVAAGLAAAPPPPDHPIIGTWRLWLPGSACIETYEYRADGTAHTLSAAEETDTQYEISAAPDARGVYVLKDTVKKTNGKPDCSGHLTPVAEPITLYLAPLRGGLLMCFDPALQRCIGPMLKVKPLQDVG